MKSSKTFGYWSSVFMSNESDFQLWVPIGFAHGFLALEDGTSITYKTTDYWNKDAEHTLSWSDPELDFDWINNNPPIVSEKDSHGVRLSEIEYFN